MFFDNAEFVQLIEISVDGTPIAVESLRKGVNRGFTFSYDGAADSEFSLCYPKDLSEDSFSIGRRDRIRSIDWFYLFLAKRLGNAHPEITTQWTLVYVEALFER